MKVILLEDVVGAGNAGDVVEVKSGYARNKLLPSGIALEANKTNMKTLEHRRAKIAAKKAADKDIAQALQVRLDGKQVDFTAKAGDSGKLFGSVTAHDIAAAVNNTLGFDIDRRKLLLDAPIKETGMHDVKYRIYPEVEAVIKVNIMAEGAPRIAHVEPLRDTYSDAVLESRDDENYSFNAGGKPEAALTEAAETAEAADEEAADETADEAADEAADGTEPDGGEETGAAEEGQ